MPKIVRFHKTGSADVLQLEDQEHRCGGEDAEQEVTVADHDPRACGREDGGCSGDASHQTAFAVEHDPASDEPDPGDHPCHRLR